MASIDITEPGEISKISKIEYQIREVSRYIITRYEERDHDLGESDVRQKGEYENPDVAYEVANALCRADHERLGWAPGDERIRYPDLPSQFSSRAGATERNIDA